MHPACDASVHMLHARSLGDLLREDPEETDHGARASGLRFRALGLGVQGLGFRALGLGVRAWSSGVRA